MAFKHPQSPNVNASRNPIGGWQWMILNECPLQLAFKHLKSTNGTTQLMVVTPHDIRRVSPILRTMKSVQMAFKHPQSPNVNTPKYHRRVATRNDFK